jgi:hypothetical protein
MYERNETLLAFTISYPLSHSLYCSPTSLLILRQYSKCAHLRIETVITLMKVITIIMIIIIIIVIIIIIMMMTIIMIMRIIMIIIQKNNNNDNYCPYILHFLSFFSL